MRVRNNNTYNDDDDDNLTTVTIATDATGNVMEGRRELAMHHQPKQGGKYFGYCCDYRRAVLILGTFHAALALLDLIFYIGNSVADDTYQPPFDDDGLVDAMLALRDDYRLPLMMLEVAGVIFGCVSVAGACYFSRILTVIAILYAVSSTVIAILLDVNGRSDLNHVLLGYGVTTVPTPTYYYVFVGIRFVVWWHPSFFFLWEVHRGIMTPETYIREDYSCFCR